MSDVSEEDRSDVLRANLQLKKHEKRKSEIIGFKVVVLRGRGESLRIKFKSGQMRQGGYQAVEFQSVAGLLQFKMSKIFAIFKLLHDSW